MGDISSQSSHPLMIAFLGIYSLKERYAVIQLLINFCEIVNLDTNPKIAQYLRFGQLELMDEPSRVADGLIRLR